jgi:hypothetical protein
VALIAALSLLLQVLTIPYHQAQTSPAAYDTARVAAELKRTFGEAAVLCVQTDGRDDPGAPAGSCDDRCPLCRLSNEVSAVVAPDLPALPVRMEAEERLAPAVESLGLASWPARHNRARAPPLFV